MVSSPNQSLEKQALFQHKKIQLTSPLLHIGSEVQRLSPFEYVQFGKRVYLPNQEALARALRSRGYLNDYIQRIQDRDEIASLLKDAFGDRWQQATNEQGEALFPAHMVLQKWTDQRITNLRPMIRNGMGQLYIPGSSIKGAIRTAIAYHLIKHADQYNVPKAQQRSDIEEKLLKSMGEIKKCKERFDNRLFMDALFTDFGLVYGNRSIRARQGPNTDFMRAVHVTDSEPLIEQEVVNKKGQRGALNLPIAAEVVVSSYFADDRANSYRAKYHAPIYVEMVRLAQTHFTISLDDKMLTWFRHNQNMRIPFQTIDDILKLCQDFAQDQWDFEYNYWQSIQNSSDPRKKSLDFSHIRSFYEAETCPYGLRIGWGSGMAGTTINMLLKDPKRWAEIRDAVGKRSSGAMVPKSRRTVVGATGEIRYVPGWVKFKS